MAAVSVLAKEGYATGTNELYDRARPSYQATAISHIRQAMKSPTPFNVVEIGSGTGIFTRALLGHPEWSSSVIQLKAVEPSEGMRAMFIKTVKDDRVSVADGTFDNTYVEDGWADIIVIAQAFHWCPDYDSAWAEFARILKPNGIIAGIWNIDDKDKAGWLAQLRGSIESHDKGTLKTHINHTRQACNLPSYKNVFQPPEEKQWGFTLSGTVDLCINRALSSSSVAILSEQEKALVKKDVQEIVAKGDDKIWIDQEQGVFEWPYKTLLFISHRKL